MSAWTSEADRALPVAGLPQGRQAGREAAGQGGEQEQHAGLRQADPSGWGGGVRIVSDPPLIVPIEEVFEGVDAKAIEKRLLEVYAAYVRTLDRDVRQLVERYRFVHAAHKVVRSGQRRNPCLDPAAARP